MQLYDFIIYIYLLTASLSHFVQHAITEKDSAFRIAYMLNCYIKSYYFKNCLSSMGEAQYMCCKVRTKKVK